MKAIAHGAYGSADHFTEVDLPMPELRRGEVRIRVRAISFNPVDYQIRRGQVESAHVRSMILGRDLSGTIESTHESVTELKVGDEVFSNVCNLASSGTYAEYVSVPAELVAKKPAFLTHVQAAAVPVAGITALLALNKARVSNATSLFIAGGAGGVGSFAIQLSRLMGVRKLITTAGSTKSRAFLREKLALREEQIVDYNDIRFLVQALKRNAGEFDVALDLVGGRLLSGCCELLAVDGNLVSAVDAPNHEDFEILFRKNASFHSVGAHAYSLTDDRTTWRKYREMLEFLARAFDSGALAPPCTTNVGPFSTQVVKQAHELLEGNAVQGKLVMAC